MTLDENTQKFVDDLSAGYIKMFTNVEAEVIEPGRIRLDRKFGKTSNIVIDTTSHEDKMILCITDDEDLDLYVEEAPADLEEIADRINQIIEMEENGEL